jgi:hypothetical protein
MHRNSSLFGQPKTAAALKELRARDAAQAIRDHDTNRAARMALTARLRAIRLAKEAETRNSAVTKARPAKKAK